MQFRMTVINLFKLYRPVFILVYLVDIHPQAALTHKLCSSLFESVCEKIAVVGRYINAFSEPLLVLLFQMLQHHS